MTALAAGSPSQALYPGFAEVTGPAPQPVRVVGVDAHGAGSRGVRDQRPDLGVAASSHLDADVGGTSTARTRRRPLRTLRWSSLRRRPASRRSCPQEMARQRLRAEQALPVVRARLGVGLPVPQRLLRRRHSVTTTNRDPMHRPAIAVCPRLRTMPSGSCRSVGVRGSRRRRRPRHRRAGVLARRAIPPGRHRPRGAQHLGDRRVHRFAPPSPTSTPPRPRCVRPGKL